MASVDFSTWDASKAWSNGANSDDPAKFYDGICAGKKSGDPSTQAGHALPYKYHPGDGPNADGVRNALARLGQTEGLTNKSAAEATLNAALKEVQAAESKKSAELKTARAQRGLPIGQYRMPVFGSQMRAQLVQRDGKNFFEVEGYATTFNKPYVMYDMFGEYTERIASTALDASLANPNLDVAFLLNHRGMTMARTTNGTLTLTKDKEGLKTVALLNADRADVRDMVSAINDGLVDEMSFAFMVDDEGYQWNDDFSELTMTRIDINRGDVSAVNYGANPTTSIAMRAPDIIRELRELPAGALAAAQRAITERAGDVLEEAAKSHVEFHQRVAAEHVIRLRELAAVSAPELQRHVKPGDRIAAQNKLSADDIPAETPEVTGGSVDLLAKRFRALYEDV